MQDRFYFGTNTKMFKTAAETVDYLRRLEELTHGIPPERAQRFVIPSYTSLGPARAELDRAGSGILLGAQNMGWEERGQYTGEISPLMLREAGARLVEDNAGRRMWEFAVEVDVGDTHISGGAFVDAYTGEIVLFDYASGGNG